MNRTRKIAPRLRTRIERLSGGRQGGVELLQVDNGRLAVTLCPTRGMGILTGRCDDVRLGWDSPVCEVVHPRHLDLARSHGNGWLDGFNEFVVRCGLQSIGRPGPDVVTQPGGAKKNVMLTLHGGIANRPATAVSIRTAGSGPSRRLVVRGKVAEPTATGGLLELATEFSTRAGSRRFCLRDTITNRGSGPEEFSVLYHINLGPPLLGDGARLLAPVHSVAAMNAKSVRRLGTFRRYHGPRRGAREEVFALRLRPDRAGRAVIALANPAGDRAFSIAFSTRALPCVTLWKQLGGDGERYVTGLEPGTNFPQHRSRERTQGRLRVLAPGASHEVRLDCTVHIGAAAVRRIAARGEALQGAAGPHSRSAREFFAARNARTRDLPFSP
jgi:Domain of unknown function (DUF4432)